MPTNEIGPANAVTHAERILESRISAMRNDFDVDTHALRIRLTELVCTDRFCHQERDDKGDADHSRRDRYVAPAHAGEASL